MGDPLRQHSRRGSSKSRAGSITLPLRGCIIGKKSSKTKTKSEPPKWAQPVLQGAGNTILNTVNDNSANLGELSSGIQKQLPALKEMAFGDNPGLNAANDYASATLGGNYLNNNPYIDEMANTAGMRAGNAVNSAFSMAGRTGGQNHAQALARGVAEANNNMRGQNYQFERGQQSAAAGMLPSLTQAKYAGVTPYLAANQLAGQLPYYGIQNLGQVGGLYSGYGTQTSTQPSGGLLGGLLGAASNMFSFAPISLSEREAKADIEAIGEWGNTGLTKYRFRYKNDPDKQMQVGVMADEVEAKYPKALGPRLANGWRTVNYAELGAA